MKSVTNRTMRWSSGLSDQTSPEKAVRECVEAVRAGMDGAPADLAAAFVSLHFADRYERVAELLLRELGPRTFFGCSAGGVLAGGREIENSPGLSVTAASLPDVSIHPFSLRAEDVPDLDASPRVWEAAVGVQAADEPQFLLLADPFSFPADDLLMGLDYAFPKSTKVGGLASGAMGPGQNALFLNDRLLRSGAIGLALRGNIRVDAVVAQGCRPIGEPMRVTECHQNLLLSLDGKPPLEVLEEVASGLDERDRDLLQHSLFLGLAIDPAKDSYGPGDFLIRNIVGVDLEKGVLAAGALLRPGQTIQFHLRDGDASAEDLAHMLSRVAPLKKETRGAMLFSCLGRGEHLYGRPDHDSRMFLESVGPVPLGGFFCNGEIGPVGGATHLHGYTSCFGLFRPKTPS